MVEKVKETLKTEPTNSRPNYNFENFIVGSSNKLAHAASWRVATAELGTVYNPLFIYGNSGLGKTHLMMAIQDELRKRYKNIRPPSSLKYEIKNEILLPN